VTDDIEPIELSDDLLVYADELQVGDRSIVHGGLTVIEVRRSSRRPECIEVDFRDDDGKRDMFVIHQAEMQHIVRPVLVDAASLDAELAGIDDLEDDDLPDGVPPYPDDDPDRW
jgi:hypothetical protein